jgi:hypothetical protein
VNFDVVLFEFFLIKITDVGMIHTMRHWCERFTLPATAEPVLVRLPVINPSMFVGNEEVVSERAWNNPTLVSATLLNQYHGMKSVIQRGQCHKIH